MFLINIYIYAFLFLNEIRERINNFCELKAFKFFFAKTIYITTVKIFMHVHINLIKALFFVYLDVKKIIEGAVGAASG